MTINWTRELTNNKYIWHHLTSQYTQIVRHCRWSLELLNKFKGVLNWRAIRSFQYKSVPSRVAHTWALYDKVGYSTKICLCTIYWSKLETAIVMDKPTIEKTFLDVLCRPTNKENLKRDRIHLIQECYKLQGVTKKIIKVRNWCSGRTGH